MQWVCSLLFTTYLFVSTPFYAVFVLAVSWLPDKQLYGVAQFWARNQLWVLRKLCGLTYTVEGLENLPEGNHISMWKHSSAWEAIAQMVVFPPQSWVLKRELMWIPLVGWAMRSMRPIAINRKAGGSAVNQVLSQGTRRLAEGRWILIFPEGTRMAPGETRRYGVSGALLGARTGRLVVPVAHNAGYFWQRRGLLKRAGVIRVVIGPPIATAGRDPRSINDEAQSWIESTVDRLKPEFGRGAG
jgi:1-acyl-sn-glycerol-3-phosphate acyltransferase